MLTTVFVITNILNCALRYGYSKINFNIGFVGANITLACERKFILEVFTLFKCILQDNLQSLRLITLSDVKSKLLAFS